MTLVENKIEEQFKLRDNKGKITTREVAGNKFRKFKIKLRDCRVIFNVYNEEATALKINLDQEEAKISKVVMLGCELSSI